MQPKHESNRQAWNEAAVAYRKGIDQGVAFLRGGGKNFCPPEVEILAAIISNCERVIHLQCAGGTDTLSFINLGVKEVIGVDISEEMIAVAREKTNQLGMNAKWIASDILNTPSELNHTADLVYSGRGAINWIMDIEGWAHVVARLLKPGAYFYLFEGHPFTYFFKMEEVDLTLDPSFVGYFSSKDYESKDWPSSYVGAIKESVEDQATKFERAWPVSSVVNALIGAGLVVQRFDEHPDAYWKEFPNMPEETRSKFPNTFSLLMRKPS